MRQRRTWHGSLAGALALAVAAGPVLSSPTSVIMSVLERVLAQIDNATNLAQVNGTYVNIAENLGGTDGSGIDGSITNIVNGVTASSIAASISGLSPVEYVVQALDYGTMSTTTLGAVNTGEISLGVNQAVGEAKTTATGAYSAVVDQIGGSADTGALVLNVSSNMSGINGSINTALTAVNGTLGNMSTTTLGAVNTGSITSGIGSAIQGIVGLSGTNH